MLVLETAEAKAGSVATELRGLGYAEVRVTRDLAGRERVVEPRLGPYQPALAGGPDGISIDDEADAVHDPAAEKKPEQQV